MSSWLARLTEEGVDADARRDALAGGIDAIVPDGALAGATDGIRGAAVECVVGTVTDGRLGGM